MSLNEACIKNICRYPGFTCFKSSSPVHYPQRWQRDALLRAAFDPTVSAIAPLSTEHWGKPPIEFGFRVTISELDFAYLVCDDGKTVTEGTFDGPEILVTRQSLATEPLLSASRAVWARKRSPIQPQHQFLALQAASDTIQGVSLSALLRALDTTLPQGLESILAMLANGILIGDFHHGIVPPMMVRPGPAFRYGGEEAPSERLRALLVASVRLEGRTADDRNR